MATRAVLRFTPVFDPRIIEVPGLARDLMVQRGAIEKIRLDEPTPVVINHDMDRQVGTVREIYTAPSVDGGHVRDWFYASCEITDPPGWLKVNGGVSWSYRTLQRQDVNGTERLLRALIDEISILTPSTRPAEPLARGCSSSPQPRRRRSRPPIAPSPARSSTTRPARSSGATTRPRSWCGDADEARFRPIEVRRSPRRAALRTRFCSHPDRGCSRGGRRSSRSRSVRARCAGQRGARGARRGQRRPE